MNYLKACLVVTICILCSISFAQIPQTMSYQGTLANDTGQPVANGDYEMTFRVYDVSAGGTAVWEEIQTISVVDGIFNAILGSSNALDIAFDQSYWLGVTIADGSELDPRIELSSSAYSLNTRQVLGTSNVFPSDGNVGIGTTSPTASLDVVDYIKVSNSFGNRLFEAREESTNLGIMQVCSGNVVRAKVSGNGDSFFNGGNVGIGTIFPSVKLDVSNNVRIQGPASWPSSGEGLDIAYRPDINLGIIQAYDHDQLQFGNLYLGNGNVGIGTETPQGKLDVNGTIYQRGSVLHADYVFDSDYQLESIEEHAQFMWKNKHLKAIPKAAVDKDGQEIVEVGSHRKGIVEELETAHIYIEQLLNKIKGLEKRLVKLEKNQN